MSTAFTPLSRYLYCSWDHQMVAPFKYQQCLLINENDDFVSDLAHLDIIPNAANWPVEIQEEIV